MLPFIEQLYAFGMTILAGMTAGLFFDMYRLVRRGLRPRQSMSWLIDLLFWFVVTPVVFTLLLMGNWGELRFYVFLGLASGAALYFGFVSDLVLTSLNVVFQGIGRFLFFLFQTVVSVLTWPFRLVQSITTGRRWGSPRLGRSWRPRAMWWPGGSWTPALWRIRGRRI